MCLPYSVLLRILCYHLLVSLNSFHSILNSLLTKLSLNDPVWECHLRSPRALKNTIVQWKPFLSDASRWLNKEAWTHNFLSLTFSSFECLNKFLPSTRIRQHFIHSWEMIVGHQIVFGVSSHIDNLKSDRKKIKQKHIVQCRALFYLKAFTNRWTTPTESLNVHVFFYDQEYHIFWFAQTEFQFVSVVLA